MVRLIIPVGVALLMSLSVSPVVRADSMMLSMARLPATEHTPVSTDKTIRHCEVTSVHDGDSMRIRCPGSRNTIPVRLDQIDAPELDQPYGKKSRDFLRSMCPVGQKAKVHDLGPDTYDRRLGRVFCKGVDVNAKMVETGAAWVYDYHATDKTLYELQDQARSKKRGLWAAPQKPLSPREFRVQQRR